ncbi:unnamed protein product [Symbiodinium sp. CCMP2592]|nr:unnamed protein product [Symbiodinium sp. CCMP2592]
MASGGGSNDGWWSDEDWRKWREDNKWASAGGKQGADAEKKLSLKQERIKEKDNFVQKQLADAAALLQRSSGQSSSSSSSSAALKFEMPSEWSVTIFNADERDKNEKRKQQSFADLGRLCNNRLKSMYQVWQSEATALRLQGGLGHQAAVTLLSQEKLDTRQKTDEQEAKIEALESELRKLRNEMKEKDMKLLATEKVKDNHKKECDEKVSAMSEECAQKLLAKDEKVSAMSDECAKKLLECENKVSAMSDECALKLVAMEKQKEDHTKECDKKLRENSEEWQRKMDFRVAEVDKRHTAMRLRAAHTFGKWKERCSNLETRLRKKKDLLLKNKLEIALSKDWQKLQS